MSGFGLFQEQVTIFNRAPVNLTVRFDGQESTIPPGITHGFPKLAVAYALKQNPVMGSEDPFDPTSWRSLIQVQGHKKHNNFTPMTEQEWAAHCGSPQVINREELDAAIKEDDPKAKIVVRGRKKPSSFQADMRQNEDGGGFANGA